MRLNGGVVGVEGRTHAYRVHWFIEIYFISLFWFDLLWFGEKCSSCYRLSPTQPQFLSCNLLHICVAIMTWNKFMTLISKKLGTVQFPTLTRSSFMLATSKSLVGYGVSFCLLWLDLTKSNGMLCCDYVECCRWFDGLMRMQKKIERERNALMLR